MMPTSNKSRFHRRHGITLVILTSLVFIAIVPIPVHVERDMIGCCWDRDENGAQETITIHVNGWYFCSLLLDNSFYGWYTIDTDLLTKQEPQKQLKFEAVGGFRNQAKAFFLYNRETNQLQRGGAIVEYSVFKKIAGQTSDGRLYAAPADSQEDAKVLWQQLLRCSQ